VGPHKGSLRHGAPQRLPTFLVIGAMKAGTTSLYHYLRAHPQVFMPAVKEIAFFAKEDVWRRGIPWYRQQFASAGPAVVALGEASTRYTNYPLHGGVPERIARHVPDARLLYLLRDPIERIRSHYQHRIAVGTERLPLEEALFSNPIYLDFSRYGMQIEQYLEHFSRDQLLIVTSEDLRTHRQVTMRRIYEFLDVDSSYVPDNLDREFYKSSDRRQHSPLAWPVRNVLKRHFPKSKRAKEWFDSRRRWSIRSSAPRLGNGDSASVAPRSGLVIPDDISSKLRDSLREDVGRLRAYGVTGLERWGVV
jgi:hypothetical protein